MIARLAHLWRWLRHPVAQHRIARRLGAIRTDADFQFLAGCIDREIADRIRRGTSHIPAAISERRIAELSLGLGMRP